MKTSEAYESESRSQTENGNIDSHPTGSNLKAIVDNSQYTESSNTTLEVTSNSHAPKHKSQVLEIKSYLATAVVLTLKAMETFMSKSGQELT